MKQKIARLADRPEDFQRLSIHPTEIAQKGDTVAETVTSHGIWEQMYFGLDEDV